ncbi:MAG: large conductance mechanosensitive channel protein MscL [Pseudomonadota bacterium]
MFSEFKAFIMRGNVMDLAVGVIIGGAFSAIVKSLVDDVLMPIIGAIFGGLDFSNYFAPLAEGVSAATLDAAKEQGAVLAYGSFITAVINFLIIGFIIFLIVRSVNKLMESTEEEEEEAPAEPPAQEVLLTEIRDLLKK